MTDYADQVIMSIDGVDYDIASFSQSGSFGGRKAVPTMNATGRPKGTRQRVGEVTITIEAPVHADQPEWESIQDATIVFRQRVDGPPDYTYFGCFYDEDNPKADHEGDQVVSVTLGCLDRRVGV